MNFKADLIEALTDTVTHQSKAINGLLVNGDRLQQVVEMQTKVIETLTQLKERSENEAARLKGLSDELLACLLDVLDADGDLYVMDFDRYRAAVAKATGEVTEEP